MNTTLHMVMGGGESLADCLGMVRTGDTLLLAGAGVMTLAAEWPEPEQPLKIYALETDVCARGLVAQAEARRVELLSDPGWVALVTRHHHTLSWK